MLGIIALSFVDGAMGTSKEVPASEVLAKIKAGLPVEFDNCAIVGDLNLSTLKIEGPVHFNNTHFLNQVIFNSTEFNSTAYFWHSNFNSTAHFWYSNFNSTASFPSSKFREYTDFRGSLFNGTVDFKNAEFNGTTDFRDCEFNGDAYFGDYYGVHDMFNGPTDFSYSKFNSDAFFSGARFNGPAYFFMISFNGSTSFFLTNFNDLAYIMESTFNGDADFGNSYFEKGNSFSDDTFNGNCSFDFSQFKEDVYCEGAKFNKELSLDNFIYNKIYIRWYNIKNRQITYDDAAYLSLLRNFKELGYFEDYDSCYFQYRKAHREQPWPLVSGIDQPIMKGIDVFLEWFYGYGTKPLNAAYFSIAIILAFGIFWRAVGLGGPDDVTGKDDKDWEKPDSIFDVLSFSTTIFLSGTKLFIDPPDIPKIKRRSRSIVKKAFTFERILGALFSILFFLAISGTVVR